MPAKSNGYGQERQYDPSRQVGRGRFTTVNIRTGHTTTGAGLSVGPGGGPTGPMERPIPEWQRIEDEREARDLYREGRWIG